jgi:sodium transport system permease protein
MYSRELRGAMREKVIIINGILMPLLLYPFLLWAAFTGILFVTGQTEGFISRVVVLNWPRAHPKLQVHLQRNEHIELLELEEPPAALEKKLRHGQLDAMAEFLPAEGVGARLTNNFRVRITFDQSKERSAEARQRLVDEVNAYRADWLKREGRRRGIDAAAWQAFSLTTRNVASEKQMGTFILGLTAPVLFLVMVAVGCFYPAIDSTAGERERNTWETLMSTAASRLNIVTGKYLYVATMGGLAGLLNLAAVILTIKPLFAPLLAQTGRTIEATIPPAAMLAAGLAAVLLAGFIAAAMMLFACFARTFKEGQAMITPFYLLILLPVVFLQAPGLKFSLPLAFVPVVNLVLLVREALAGIFQWAQIAVALAISVALIAVCLRLAAAVLQFEDVLMGSYNGSFPKFVKGRMLGRARPAEPKTREN